MSTHDNTSDTGGSDLADAQGRAIAIGQSRAGRFTLRTITGFVRTFGYRYLRVRVRGADHLNTPGPLIIAPVHRSNLDAPLIACASKRRFWALGKKSLFSNPAFGWLVSALGSFPVERGTADRDAIKAAEQLLNRGEALIVFPEGTRQSGPKVGEVFDGAAFMAARTGARVVVVGVAGTEDAMPSGAKFPRRSNVVIVAGEPLDPPELTDKGRLTLSARRNYSALVAERLQAAFDEAIAESEFPL